VSGTPRLFVPAECLADGQLRLHGRDAARVRQSGAHQGSTLLALDNSGWETTVLVEEAEADFCRGRVLDRHLATERRTKVSLYHGLLHPLDFRRLIGQATALGVVAFVPVITDSSVLPGLSENGSVAGSSDWPRLAREAAERSGRGRLPEVGPMVLFDQALDQARSSGAALILGGQGLPLADALVGRPFSLDIFCPPPGGFSDLELAHASARGLRPVARPRPSADPVAPALAVIRQVYDALEV
jgi:16S rRNA (uracil1498-N3)-methyltransferase